MAEKHFSILRTPAGYISGPITNSSVDPKPKEKRAQGWIAVLPHDYQPIPEPVLKSVKDLTGDEAIDQKFAGLEHQTEVEIITRRRWGIPTDAPLTPDVPLPPGVFTFKAALLQPWCPLDRKTGRKFTEGKLRNLCDRAGCPKALLERGVITEIGCCYAVSVEKERQKQQQAEYDQRRPPKATAKKATVKSVKRNRRQRKNARRTVRHSALGADLHNTDRENDGRQAISGKNFIELFAG
jgi:hypothetical protein